MMKPEIIEQSQKLWSQEPDKAKVSPVVKARSDGTQAVVEAGPFSWQCDLPPVLGGENKAASPTAILLGALAGCAVVFIRDVLAPQQGVRVEAVEAEARCRADFRGLLAMPGAAPDLHELELPSTSAHRTARRRSRTSIRLGSSAARSIWRLSSRQR